MKKIDDALALSTSPPRSSPRSEPAAEGETLHNQGKHQESLDTLGKAEKILNIQ
jgi:hypothetical protein